MVVTLALILDFSPGRRNSDGAASDLRVVIRQVQPDDIPTKRRMILLRLGDLALKLVAG